MGTYCYFPALKKVKHKEVSGDQWHPDQPRPGVGLGPFSTCCKVVWWTSHQVGKVGPHHGMDLLFPDQSPGVSTIILCNVAL